MARQVREGPPPSREDVLRFVEGPGRELKRRELVVALAREYGHTSVVKSILRDLAHERAARRRGGHALEQPAVARRPPVGVYDVTAVDEHGDLVLQHPDRPDEEVILAADALEGTAPGEGDRVLVRVRAGDEGRLEAQLIKLLERQVREVAGVLELAGEGWRLRSADRRMRLELFVDAKDLAGADRGDLVTASVLSNRRLGLPRAKVTGRIGRPDEPGALGLLSAMGAGIPMTFPEAAVEQATAARPVSLGRRTDLRDLPLVTIDGEDARDFDDAVWAAADDDARNAGGHRLVVAIADVAHYVRPGDALDREARKRGNSVYLPDRAIPMLPEALSNDLCSLRADEDRACLACEMVIDAQGELRRFHFVRGLMRSRARLTYTQVQAAAEGRTDVVTAPLLEPALRPLYAAYEVLQTARRRRGTIELEIPERRIAFDEAGQPVGVTARRRLPAHMLIEEMMITANVAAASLLEEAHEVCLYRVHDRPDSLRLQALAEFLERLGLPWSRTAKQPGELTALLGRIEDPRDREMVSGLVLRAQAQAVYTPRNIGHFGLNLKRYAHFTSPIRRYADLVVHRAIIRQLGFGAGGLPDAVDEAGLASLGDHLSKTERRAMEAERRAHERFTAAFMATRVGASFTGRIGSVVYFGLFVVLDDTGAEGLVPVSTLGSELFALDERHQALVGQRSGEVYGLGDPVRVTLAEADPIQGTLVFRLEEHEPGPGATMAKAAWRKAGGRTHRGRPPMRPPRGRRR